jgi:hypothetical protein
MFNIKPQIMTTTVNTQANHSVLYIVLTSLLLLHMLNSNAQNVGIGTNNPQRKLTVNGSVMVDQGNMNDGTLDTSALVFGTFGGTGISSKKVGFNTHALAFWTGGVANMNISSAGNVGIGGASAVQRLRVYGNAHFEGNVSSEGTLQALGHASIGGVLDPLYKLRVYDGETRLGGDMHATGNVAIGGIVDNNYRLRVIGGNTRFGGDMHATGNVAIGGEVDNNFRLRVIGGNSRFGGDVEITGEATAASMSVDNALSTGTLTIGGKGSVRSNGASPLRIGFSQKTVDVVVNANSDVAVVADISDFSGDNDDVRVFVSQIVNDPLSSGYWQRMTITVMGVNATNDTCLLWIHNHTGGNVVMKGTIYLTTIAKN